MTDQNILLQENGYPNAPDIKALRTVTYDPAVYKLAPIASQHGIPDLHYETWEEVIAAVPDQLQGVVEHSGEPVGEVVVKHGGLYADGTFRRGLDDGKHNLFLHPAPSQPSAEAFDVWMQNPYTKVLQESIKTDYMPKVDAEAIVQAALEAAATECNRMKMFPGGRQECYAHHGVDTAAAAIRALSAQQIIEEASK